MIRITDALLLAFTKLRTRKIRTGITVAISGFLFALLVAGSLAVTGGFKSVDNLAKDSLTNRFIVSVNPVISPDGFQKIIRDPVLIAQAKDRYRALVGQKTAEAKRLGVPYSQASDQPPYTEGVGQENVERLAFGTNPIVQQILNEKYAGTPSFNETQLAALAKQYHATALYSASNYGVNRGASLNILPKGQEVFYDQSDTESMNKNYTRPILDASFNVVPSQLSSVYVFKNSGGWQPDSGSLPIILPQDTIQQILGTTSASAKATAAQKLDWLTALKKQATGLTFQACYRNQASTSLINQTIAAETYARQHQTDKDYVAPKLVHALPNTATCENPTVIQDTRTAAEKKQADNQATFDDEFNPSEPPTSYFVHFTVVGMSPAAATGQPQNRSSSDILSQLLQTYGVGQGIPQNLYDKIPDKTTYADIMTYTKTYFFGNEDNLSRYVEFANAKDAEKFVDDQSCTTQYDNTCKPSGRPYQASLSFSNSAAIADLRQKVTQIFDYATIASIVVATIIMWTIIGRTMADSRRETAVFRAVGFKRIDIAFIYITYTVLLSIFIALFAAIAGYVGALFIDATYAGQLTVQAQLGYGAIDLSKHVSLIGFDARQLVGIFIACLATGILSVVIPLLRNVRRSPIQDMREE